MADTLNVYKGEELVKSTERIENEATTVTIDGLDANTEYDKGTFQVAYSNEHGESEKVDVPAFRTKPIRVSSVTIAPETLELNVGDTGNVSATVAPSTASDKSVAYTSSNEDVATVDSNGQVTAVGSGTANIEVTTNDGNRTATAAVTVAEETPDEPTNVDVEANEEDADVSAE